MSLVTLASHLFGYIPDISNRNRGTPQKMIWKMKETTNHPEMMVYRLYF